MKIPYPTRSSFLISCENAIADNLSGLLNGQAIKIHLSQQGYNRDAQVTITPTDSKKFETDWKSNHPSRFSSRIRAAALALYNYGCFGTFRVFHQKGLLTIQLLSNNGTVLYKKVAKSQYNDGVRINKNFHNLFNPPSNPSFVAKGESRPVKIKFNNREFTAKYLHENPRKTDRDMQSIRFSRELRKAFKETLPDQTVYFSIKLGTTVNEFLFDILDSTDLEDTEVFAKGYIRQEQDNLDAAEIDKKRRERLEKYNERKTASKKSKSTKAAYQSDPVLKEDIKQLYGYRCQICKDQIKKFGWHENLAKVLEFEYLSADAHHIVPLEQNGLDSPSNIICVCPNCHRRLHTEEFIIHFDQNGPVCRNQVSGGLMKMTIDKNHSFAYPTK